MSLRDLLAAARDRLDQGEADDAPEAPEVPAAPEAPARPAHPPTVHKQPEHHQHIGGARLPAPGTTVDVTAPAPAPAGQVKWINGVPHDVTPPAPAPDWWSTKAPAGPCQHPKLQPVRIRTGELVAYWCPDCEQQFDTAYTAPGYHDLDHQDAADEDGQDAEDEAAEQSRTRAVIDRLTKGGKGGVPLPRPANARPAPDRGPDSGPAPRAALIDRLANINPRHKSLAYHAVAFGVGWGLGIPQWATAETGYLAQHCDSWTDSMALTGYVPAAVVFYLDRKSRRASSWLAFPVRVVSVSLVIGVLLYSGPASI